MAQIDSKYLQGLKYHSSESKDVPGDGGTVIKQYTPLERDLTADDVLSVRDTESQISFVTADGRKYSFDKQPD
jgi:hypothetical protein